MEGWRYCRGDFCDCWSVGCCFRCSANKTHGVGRLLSWVSADLELGGYLCFLFLAVRSNPTTFHGRFFRSRLDCFQQSWEFGCICVCILSTRSNLTLTQLFLSVFFLCALMFSFSGAERVPMVSPILLSCFPCSEIHLRRARCCCYYRCWRFDTVQISLVTTDRCLIGRVWSTAPLNASRLSNTGHSESSFLGELEWQQIHGLFLGHYCWLLVWVCRWWWWERSGAHDRRRCRPMWGKIRSFFCKESVFNSCFRLFKYFALHARTHPKSVWTSSKTKTLSRRKTIRRESTEINEYTSCNSVMHSSSGDFSSTRTILQSFPNTY